MANLMHTAWTKHGIFPSKIYEMNDKEKFLLMQFQRLDLEE